MGGSRENRERSKSHNNRKSRSRSGSGKRKKRRKHDLTPISGSSSSSSDSEATLLRRSRKRSVSEKSPSKKEHKSKKRKRRSRSSSTSSSSSSEREERAKKKKKRKKKKSKHKKSSEKKRPTTSVDEIGPVLPLTNQDDSKTEPVPGPMLPKRSLKPMTKEEWEKQQSVVRRVFDPDTGRTRLVKGDGEIIEEIVSKDRQREINKQATLGDGVSFQAQVGLLKKS